MQMRQHKCHTGILLMIDLTPIAELLEHMGVKHAPEQHLENGEVDGRYVTLRDPFGVYYILGTDNADKRDELTEEVQLIFLRVSDEKADHYAGSIGYRFKKSVPLPSDLGPISSVILEPKHPQNVAA